ncbi:PP2C family protein-serine/threonine phosphatase [Actinoplanes sp. NPDC051859]|uniref:PP2C family protein-serine/threonine phosphatase n=1 Tax=Actinoplanes sp. NPDC051859 TaxID=3363909 RepID=UPI0037A58674
MSEGLHDLERLRRIEAVTDAALSRLDVPDLLEELLDRVVSLLDADTAAVMLVDAHARQLVATAARGLEDEVAQGLRISVGRGFSGRVARERGPVVLDEVTASDVVSPVLLAKGIRSLLGVPLFAGDDVIGVLHVGTLHPRRFTDDDVRLLQVVADRVSSAAQIRSHRGDQAAAVALQRSLLPERLPHLPGLDLAARYVPGHDFGIGGDWYDVFTLPSGWLGVVIGDVSGHGLASAIVMGRVRSALRSYALICDDPAEALTLLDHKVRHFEAGSLTTALYAMIDPDRTEVVVSSAGHLPPVLAEPDRPARLTALPIDPPLGVGRPQRPRRSTSIELTPGAALVCYTDGLVERRGQLIDDGLERLRNCTVAAPAESICAQALTGTGAEQPEDDAAILVVRRLPGGQPDPSDVIRQPGGGLRSRPERTSPT